MTEPSSLSPFVFVGDEDVGVEDVGDVKNVNVEVDDHVAAPTIGGNVGTSCGESFSSVTPSGDASILNSLNFLAVLGGRTEDKSKTIFYPSFKHGCPFISCWMTDTGDTV